jgi:CubicO group peptidase (beta-lactamase class C family)
VIPRRLVVLLVVLAAVARPAQAQRFATADSIVRSGVTRGIYPGAVLLIGRHDGVIHAEPFGHFTWRGSSPVPSPDSTLWDLASLTKVVGTLPTVLHLLAIGRLRLDAPVAQYLPRYTGSGRERVTLRMLLDHSSGLASYLPFFTLTATRDSAIALLYRQAPRHPPGSVVQYSDLNFLLLGQIIEVVTGASLEANVRRTILDPAGLAPMQYRPPAALADHTAPTGQYRGTPLCCQVNDQNAVRWGGVAGHAGLFATGAALARYARLWLNGGVLDGRQLLDSVLVRRFLTPAGPGATRLLGWERPDPKNRDDSAYGHLLSAQAYGHTGWTGTLIWIDPARDLFLVLLTNRSFGPKVPHSIRALRGVRGALADAVVREVDSR